MLPRRHRAVAARLGLLALLDAGLGTLAWRATLDPAAPPAPAGAAPVSPPPPLDRTPLTRLDPAMVTLPDDPLRLRPLFWAGRRPILPAAPIAAPVPPPAPMVASAPPDLTCDGIVIAGALRKAHLSHAGAETGQWLSLGERFEGWRLESVSASAITLAKDEAYLTLALYQPTTASFAWVGSRIGASNGP